MIVKNIYKKLNKTDRGKTKERWSISRKSCDLWLENTINDFVNDRERALIIGAGNCLDFELKTLADMFFEIDIIDLDIDSVNEAIKELPKKLQSKIRVYEGDITGVVEEKIPLLKDILLKQGFNEFLKECEKFRDGLPKTFKPKANIKIEKNYDLVFSDSITTQLFGPAFLYGIFNEKKTLDIFNRNSKKIIDYQKYTSLRMLAPYLRMIRKALKKGGVLAICSDTIEINEKNKSYLQNKYGSLGYISNHYLKNLKLMEELNSNYLITGSFADIINTNREKNIKFKLNEYAVSWLWDFNDKKQYINVGFSFSK